MPPAFVGHKFADLASALVQQREIVVVGVMSDGKIINSRRSRWELRQDDTVFVLAEDRPASLDDLAP